MNLRSFYGKLVDYPGYAPGTEACKATVFLTIPIALCREEGLKPSSAPSTIFKFSGRRFKLNYSRLDTSCGLGPQLLDSESSVLPIKLQGMAFRKILTLNYHLSQDDTELVAPLRFERRLNGSKPSLLPD